MKPEIKQKWIKALRSGEYKQTIGVLRRDDCFCANGVLCDIFAKEHNIEWKLQIGKSGRMEIMYEWAHVDIQILNYSGLSRRESNEIAVINDFEKESFERIADYIEEEL